MMMISAESLVPCALATRDRETLQSRAHHAVPIRAHDRNAVIHFEDAGSSRLFAARYRDCPAPDDADLRTYVVRDDAGTSHFWTIGGYGYTWPHGPLGPVATAFLADAVAMNALLASVPSAVALHAAAFRHRDRAFAITGRSTAGKSTTAIACVAAGCELYSDERCIVGPGGVVAFPRAVNLRGGGIDLLAEDLPPSDLRARLERRRGADWDGVHFDELFGTRALPEPAPLDALFTIAGHAAEPSSRRITAVEMLPHAQYGAIVAGTGIARAATILRSLQGVDCFELVLGSPCASAAHVLDVLGRGGRA